MPTDLKLLLLEDDPADAALIQKFLQRSGMQFRAVVASDEQEFLSAISDDGFDAVLADNALPQYSSLEALKLIRAKNPAIAFILVTGTVSEEFAVSIIQQGADDYILKTNLARLPAAVYNAIERKRMEKEKEMEKELSDSIINSLPGVFYFYDRAGNFLRWNKNFETVSGYGAAEIKEMRPESFFEIRNREYVWKWMQKVFHNGYAETEATILTKSGSTVPYFFTGSTVHFNQQDCLIGIGLDISASKESEKKLKELNQQLRNLSAHHQHIREDEQKRIAREIHDQLGQQLTGIKMDISWLKKKITSHADVLDMQNKLTVMNNLVDETIHTVRKIASELRPGILDDLGLAAALDWWGMEFAKRYSIPLQFKQQGAEYTVDQEIAIAMFRIYQEALTNIVRHAKATSILALYEANDDQVKLTITDNGKGFITNPDKLQKSLGLLGMQERASMIGGMMEIISKPGYGTTLAITAFVNNKKGD